MTSNKQEKADYGIRLEAFLMLLIHIYCYPVLWDWPNFSENTKRLWYISKTGYATAKEVKV